MKDIENLGARIMLRRCPAAPSGRKSCRPSIGSSDASERADTGFSAGQGVESTTNRHFFRHLASHAPIFYGFCHNFVLAHEQCRSTVRRDRQGNTTLRNGGCREVGSAPCARFADTPMLRIRRWARACPLKFPMGTLETVEQPGAMPAIARPPRPFAPSNLSRRPDHEGPGVSCGCLCRATDT